MVSALDCKPGSVFAALPRRRRSFLWDPHCCVPQAALPESESRADSDHGLIRDHAPLFGLAPGRVCRAVPVASHAVSSYLTVSPLPRFTEAFYSLLPFPSPRRHQLGAWPLASTLLFGARTFLPPMAFDSLEPAIARPTQKLNFLSVTLLPQER